MKEALDPILEEKLLDFANGQFSTSVMKIYEVCYLKLSFCN